MAERDKERSPKPRQAGERERQTEPKPGGEAAETKREERERLDCAEREILRRTAQKNR